MNLPWIRARLPFALLPALASMSACTSFDDAVADRGYFDVAEATAVCARVFACPSLAASLRQSILAPIDDSNFSVCLSWLAGPSPEPPPGFAAQVEALRRVTAAASCEEALGSLDVRAFPLDDPRCEGGVADRCTAEGDLIDCHAHRLVKCAGAQLAAGSTCLLAGDAGRCAVGTCPTLTKVFACDGAVLSLCEPGVKLEQRIVCAAAGESCVVTPETYGPALVKQNIEICTSSDNSAPTSVCTSHGGTACTPDGASMILCQHVVEVTGVPVTGGMEVTFGCEKDLGWRCEPGEAGAIARCVRPDAECSPTDGDLHRCDGETLEVCLSGRRASVDCGAAGATCEAGPGAAGARCVAK